MDTLTNDEIRSSESLAEEKYSGSEIKNFWKNFKQDIKTSLDDIEANNEEDIKIKPSSNGEFPKLTQEIGQSLVNGMQETVRSYTKLIPKDPIRAVLWVAIGPFAKIGQEKTGAETDLYAWKKITDHPIKPNPLDDNETIQISTQDMNDVGKVLGNLLANLALATKDPADIDPNRGKLGDARYKWSIESKDKLRLIDTLLHELK